MGQMTSNSKNESLTASEQLGTTDETVSVDATGDGVRLIQGQGMQVSIFLACNLAKQEVSSTHFG